MVKNAHAFLGCLLISISSFAGPTSLDCESSSSKLVNNLEQLEEVAENVDDCPEPTKEQFSGVCIDLYERYESQNSEYGLAYSYQEKLWKLSCAVPGKDTMEVARNKIQRMWNKHRSNFRCYNYPTSIATDANITKFSLDTGFSGFIVEAVKRYKLDMNFLDPEDKKTVLDFVVEQEALIRKTPPVNKDKADEYNRISKILEANGAKRGKDI